jgi:tRNA pseudouridine55 synthase
MPGKFHGFLVIDKPAGWTSHDVVARVRRLLNEKRVGHAGTLDPAATGVLPVAVGQATKSIEWLEQASKAYCAEIAFGVATDSADVDGVVIETGEPSGLAADRVAKALQRFEGPIEQIPPMHSAIKIDGVRLYQHARRGRVVDVPARAVTVHLIELIAWEAPVATVAIECSKGTYIRSIARDLGDALGVPAHLANLVRVRSGPFNLDEAWTLAELAELDLDAEWPSIAIHPDAAALDLDALVLDDEEYESWRHGRTVRTAAEAESRDLRVYSAAGAWIGIGRAEAGGTAIRPLRVIADAA